MMRSSSWALSRLPIFCCWLALAGCGDGKATVNGVITMDSTPVASGVVTLVKDGSPVVREGAIIKDGAFQIRLAPGTYKLELTGQKIIGKRKQKGFDGQDEEVELTGELFPERYNLKSELTQEIHPGKNEVKLDLKGTK